MKIQIAKTKEEMSACFPIMVQLRPALTEQEFIDRVMQQEVEGYLLAYIEENERVVAVTGFRVMHNLAYGKFLYVDDLITDEQSRSKGYGDALFDFLIAYAKKEGCKEFHLDSGVQRFDAHRFYLKKRMNIVCHHFGLKLIVE